MIFFAFETINQDILFEQEKILKYFGSEIKCRF